MWIQLTRELLSLSPLLTVGVLLKMKFLLSHKSSTLLVSVVWCRYFSRLLCLIVDWWLYVYKDFYDSFQTFRVLQDSLAPGDVSHALDMTDQFGSKLPAAEWLHPPGYTVLDTPQDGVAPHFEAGHRCQRFTPGTRRQTWHDTAWHMTRQGR